MSKTDKLLEKLKNGTITGPEAETLLGKLGWIIERQSGSHQVWANGRETLVLVAGRKDLRPYQVKALKVALVKE
jgi:predicted RNA binding protein YcfA (HicA-like mRNA interferase family)